MTHPTHTGRVAVVTGAARGLGQAIAVGLAERGAAVVAVDLDEPTETCSTITAAGGVAVGLRVDVSDPEQTERLGAEVDRRFGRCDIVVNNAAIFPAADITDLDFATWRNVMAVNLDGTLLTVQAVLPLMKRGKWGRIVNLTSNIIALPVPGRAAYLSSKAGIIGFTRAVATDLGSFGITVNAVGPTLSRTPGALSLAPLEEFEQVAAMQAIKRTAEPLDVLGAILFLTGEDSGFVTGQTLMADGGLARL